MLTVVIGAGRALAENLALALRQESDLYIAGVGNDDRTVLNLVRTAQPAVLVIDLALPALDALGVLQTLNGVAPRPITLVLTPSGAEPLIRALSDAGATYCLVKPVSAEVLVSRIRLLAPTPSLTKPVTPKPSPIDQQGRIRALLERVGVPSHLQGYRYLADAVHSFASDGPLQPALTKEVYPNVAEAHRTTESAVERGIRQAILSAWKRREPLFVHLFRHRRQGERPPPNAEFLATLAAHLGDEAERGGA